MKPGRKPAIRPDYEPEAVDGPRVLPDGPPAQAVEYSTEAMKAYIAQLEAKLSAVPVFINNCPPNGPEGDKTPAVMEWLAEYDPAEFVRRYANRSGELIRKLLPRAQAQCQTK